ncbi:MAG: MBL fold metallo-hydrolase, partial [Kiritimatiellia bacterium]
MSITLRFLGATQTVTGSRYLIDTGARRILVDCGLYQERDLQARNWEPFPVPPATITDVILTHAHLDHCGWLPALARHGFHGRVHATAATGDLARISLLDAARLQEEDLAFKQSRHAREKRTGPYPYTPMYTVADVETCCAQFAPVAGFGPVDLGDGVELRFREAGHILGATSVFLRIDDHGNPRTLLFSGDLGRWNKPLLRDPDLCTDADYVVMESTYGDRIHESTTDIQERMAKIITDTLRRGGNLLIPTFAIERTQEVLFHLSCLLRDNRIPHLVTFLDSPMAIRVTELFAKYRNLLDDESARMLAEGHSPFDFASLTMTR